MSSAISSGGRSSAMSNCPVALVARWPMAAHSLEPAALCLTSGTKQYLYSSNSNPEDDIDSGGEIYKLDLTGHVVGKFGRAGKAAKEFGTVNAISCRAENELLVGELGNWRVQKLTLH